MGNATKQTQGQSPFAILQQNKRDDARIFFKMESSHLFCADAQTANSPKTKQPVYRLFCF